MCGITGFFSATNHYPCQNYYEAHNLIRHRGPDDEGFLIRKYNQIFFRKGDDTIPDFQNLEHLGTDLSASCILGHRRLSILDLTHLGHQPLSCPEKTLSIVYNGEIYNYIELRNELKQLGHTFKSDCDTEVILTAYKQWGPECQNKFNGMWAFAIHDSNKNELFLSRDRFGIKPLHYCITNDKISFSSEIKFIKAFENQNFEVDPYSVKSYLSKSHINHTNHTFWKNIKSLEPGHSLTVNSRGITKIKYWNLTSKTLIKNQQEAEDEFKQIFIDSIKLRMRSDVEVGSLLSGGLDSTTIACTLNALGLTDNFKLKTFSAVFDEELFSEKKYILDTANQINIDTQFVTPKPEELGSYLSKLTYYLEEPFRSLSVFSQFKIYEKIKDTSNVKVLLNGQGADELFGGYTYHYYDLFAQYNSRFKFLKAWKELKLFKKHRKIGYGTIIKQSILPTLFALKNNDSFLKMNQNEIEKSPLREYLKYDDRTSMAFGLETRVPFLDYRLVEFAQKLDVKFKIDGYINKKVVRNFAHNLIPSSVEYRKDKMGFVSPQEVWQKGALKPDFDNVFVDIKKNGFFEGSNPNQIFNNYQEYQKGNHNNWTKIWRNYCLYKWIQNNHI